MTWVDGFKADLLRAMTEWGVTDAAEVIDWEQETEQGGYCDSCYYEEIVVEITYRTVAGEKSEYKYYGNMVNLMQTLASYE
jgi:hypothetical protein